MSSERTFLSFLVDVCVKAECTLLSFLVDVCVKVERTLLFFLVDIRIKVGRMLLFVVRTYVGGPLDVHFANSIWMYGETPDVGYFLELLSG